MEYNTGNNQGYNNAGYNNTGYSNEGYNNAGYNTGGYSTEGYNNAGNTNAGYNNNTNAGYNNACNTNAGYNYAGYNNAGYNYAGYNNAGYNNAGYNNTDQQAYQTNFAPVAQLKTNRGLLKFILLNIITLGIYGIIYFSCVSSDINIIASRYDGKKTVHYCLMIFILAPITLSIYAFVWYHQLSNRIGSELKRRGIDYSFGAKDFWLWYLLGTLIIVGPFIYIHKLSTAMNLLSNDFNVRG